MHREQVYDINKIRKHFPKASALLGGGVSLYQPTKQSKQQDAQAQAQVQAQAQAQAQAQQQQQEQQQEQQQLLAQIQEQSAAQNEAVSIQLQTAGGGSQTVTIQQIPHIAYFNPPSTPGQTGPLQGIQGVGGTKKEGTNKEACLMFLNGIVNPGIPELGKSRDSTNDFH